MALNNILVPRFDGDDFILVITIEDAISVGAYKAEFKVYEKDTETLIITEKLVKTTPTHFVPDTGGITIYDNEVHVAFDAADFASGSLVHGVIYIGRLVLWDEGGKVAVSAKGTIKWDKHPATETLA